MSIGLDRMYIGMLEYRLERFGWEREGLARCRCPMCGDSKKSERKRRFYFYVDNEKNCFRVKCHNCSEASGWSLEFWLKKYFPDMYRDYVMDRFQQDGRRDSYVECAKPEPKPKVTRTNSVMAKPKEVESRDPFLDKLISVEGLEDDHKAKAYLISRQIPRERFKLFYYTTNFKQLCQDFEPEEIESVDRMPEEDRLIIPFFDAKGKMVAFQGRCFTSNPGDIRYLTCKKTVNTPKTFGLERIIPGKPRFVVEGPIDSLFLPNCLASADADLLKVKGEIYIPDCQYRNRQINEKIIKMIDAGVKVVLFPNNFPYKDINEIVMEGGWTPKQVLEFICRHIYQGMTARMKFADLRKA